MMQKYKYLLSRFILVSNDKFKLQKDAQSQQIKFVVCINALLQCQHPPNSKAAHLKIQDRGEKKKTILKLHRVVINLSIAERHNLFEVFCF